MAGYFMRSAIAPDDQGGGDNREHHLKHGEDVFRKPSSNSWYRGRSANSIEHQVFHAPKEPWEWCLGAFGGMFTEDQAVPADDPENGDQSGTTKNTVRRLTGTFFLRTKPP